jgi:hypothetical protein
MMRDHPGTRPGDSGTLQKDPAGLVRIGYAVPCLRSVAFDGTPREAWAIMRALPADGSA